MSRQTTSSPFGHRLVLGAWINDLGSQPRVEQWPSIHYDRNLFGDLTAFFDLMSECELDSICLLGLFAAGRWSPKLEETISPDRDRWVRSVIDAAHERGLKMYGFTGVYSWGYETFIEQNPELRGDNPRVMCPAREASEEVMRQVIDFQLTNYDFDGLHLESGDQGRCTCERCLETSDLDWHIEVNHRTALYLRDRWPEIDIEVYTPGVNKTEREWLAWVEASSSFTFLVDADIHLRHADVAGNFGPTSRRRIVEALQCAYATRGGRWVYPPQRWDRLRWFLPLVDCRVQHWRAAAAEGARASMTSGAPIVNPGEEATLRATGKVLADPTRESEAILVETMREMFTPHREQTAQDLAEIFWWAEKSYFANANFLARGEILCEPLFGHRPGPPTYLECFLYAGNLLEYRRSLDEMLRRAQALKGDVGDPGKLWRVIACLGNALADVDSVRTRGAWPRYPASVIDETTWTDQWVTD